MPENSSPTITLDDVTEFNDQLRRLERAGVQLDLGAASDTVADSTSRQSLDKQLDRILAHLANEQSRGSSTGQLIDCSKQIPAAYRLAIQSWCYGDKSLSAFDVLHQPAVKRSNLVTDVSLSLIHPLFVLVLSLIAWIYLTLVVTPRMASVYEHLNEQPSWQVQLLLLVKQWLPWWSSLIPLTVLAALLWWQLRKNQWSFAWIPGRKQALVRSDAEQLANSLADVSQRGQSSGCQQMLASVDACSPSLGSRSPSSLPLLGWARQAYATSSMAEHHHEQSQTTQSLPYTLAADFYRVVNATSQQRRKRWLPVAMGVILGGTLVLLYCLALFSPIVAMLFDVIRASR